MPASKALSALGSVLLVVIGFGIVAAKFLLPSKTQAKRQRYEEQQRREAEANKPSPTPPPAPTVPAPPSPSPAPIAKPAPAPPPAPAVSPVFTEQLQLADRHFAAQEYRDAYRAYRVAENWGKLDAAADARKDGCYAVINLTEVRDAFRQLEDPNRSLVMKSLEDLEKIDPAKLPSDAWREEYRKTVKGLEGAAKNAPAPRQQR